MTMLDPISYKEARLVRQELNALRSSELQELQVNDKRLPNGIVDEIDLGETGEFVFVRRISHTHVVARNNITLGNDSGDTQRILIDFGDLFLEEPPAPYSRQDPLTGTFYFDGRTWVINTTPKLSGAESIGKFTIDANSKGLVVVEEKGITLEQARDKYEGTEFYYQLKEPEISPITGVTSNTKLLLKLAATGIHNRKRNLPDTIGRNVPFIYDVRYDGETYTNFGILKLPPNYTPYGNPVPLVIFCHEANVSYASGKDTSFKQYEPYIQYLADEGFAVFDCWDWPSKYAHVTTSDNMGSPIVLAAIAQGYRRIVNDFNVSETQVYMSGKSQGGRKAINMCYHNSIPLRACGLLAPAVSPVARGLFFGYSPPSRHAHAEEFGFSEDVHGLLDYSGVYLPMTEELKDYMRDNLPRTIGYMPMWNGLVNADLDELIEHEISKGTSRVEYYDTLSRVCTVPTKIWVAPDDTNISVKEIEMYVKTLKNGQSIADLRMLQPGTGGHNATDLSPTAEKVQDVTTELGIHYDHVPVAWVELVQWFRRF